MCQEPRAGTLQDYCGISFELKCNFHKHVTSSPVIAFHYDESPASLFNLEKG